MNQRSLELLCEHFDLGVYLQDPTRVYGGLLHKMWRLETSCGVYAVKQLSPDINVTDESVIKNYELSERVAARFAAQGIPAVSALNMQGNALYIIGETGFLVYPWVDAKALDQHAVSEGHALKIAALLAAMHRINLQEPEVNQSALYLSAQSNIPALISKAESFGCSFAQALRDNQDALLAAYESYGDAVPILQQDVLVGHGDLDQKNILWDSNSNPILIDWESVCTINPTYDIINTAFYWSGITSNFNKDVFFKMLNAYQIAGGIINKDHVEASCYGTFSWIGWLVYNIERACVSGESEQKTLGIEQVNQTLAAILRLQKVIPDIITEIGRK